MLIDPLGDGAFLGIERKEELVSQTLTLPVCRSTPWLETTRGIREEQAHLALKDLVQMACGSPQQTIGVGRAGELAAQRVECRRAPFAVARRFRLLPQAYSQRTDDQRYQQHDGKCDEILQV